MPDDIDDDLDINFFDLDDPVERAEAESDTMPPARSAIIKKQIRKERIRLKAKKKNQVKRSELMKQFPSLPGPGEALHIVSSGNFDFWTFIPYILEMTGTIEEAYISTWSLDYDITVDILDLLDIRKIRHISVLTGLYFKRRETSVYATLVEGLQKRGHRYVAFENHAKVTLLQNEAFSLVVEGSANMTANPRLEQFIVHNSQELLDFHKSWMDESFRTYRDK